MPRLLNRMTVLCFPNFPLLPAVRIPAKAFSNFLFPFSNCRRRLNEKRFQKQHGAFFLFFLHPPFTPRRCHSTLWRPQIFADSAHVVPHPFACGVLCGRRGLRRAPVRAPGLFSFPFSVGSVSQPVLPGRRAACGRARTRSQGRLCSVCRPGQHTGAGALGLGAHGWFCFSWVSCLRPSPPPHPPSPPPTKLPQTPRLWHHMSFCGAH